MEQTPVAVVGRIVVLGCRRCGCDFLHIRAKGRLPWSCPPCRPLVHNERGQRWVQANPEKRATARRRWVTENPEKQAAAAERWRQANMEKWREYGRRTKKKHPKANAACVARHKARKRAATIVPFTPLQLDQRLAYFGHRCWICGAPGDTVDHVKPLAKGGAHALANIRPACLSCNSRKGDRWPVDLTVWRAA